MIRRNGSGRLGGQSAFRQDNINPLETVANLVDVMLVLAVGIMLALIVSWNLNIAENGQVNDNAKKEDALSSFSEEDIDTSDTKSENLEKQGTVYYDPETDKFYVIAQDGSQMTLDGNN